LQCLTDVFEPVGVGDLRAVGLGNVKHVDHLVEVGADFRQIDRDAQLVQRVGDCVQQSRAVVRKHVDDGAAVGGIVVNDDAQRQVGDRAAAAGVQTAVRREPRFGRGVGGQHPLQRAADVV